MTDMPDSLLSKSAQGASFLIILQVTSRALTFILNHILLRFLSPQILGVSTQLELFSVSTLYFSRESIRVALQRRGDHDSEPEHEQGGGKKDVQNQKQKQSRSLQEAINLSYVSIVLGVALTVALRRLYFYTATAEVNTTPYFRKSLNLYAIATILELLHEPFFVTAQNQLEYGVRTSAEMQATILRCFVTSGTAFYANRKSLDLGVLPFAVGQLSYAIALLIGYAVRLSGLYASTGTSHLLRRPTALTEYIPTSLLKLSALMYAQGLFKLLLTSGDAYLVAALTSLSSQGAYALATNYGGLLARVLFQPVEEASRVLLARLLPATPTKTNQSKKDLEQAISYLKTLFHFYSLLSVVLIFFAPPFIPSLFNLVAGPRWSETNAPKVLAAYCYYIPLMAFNGILEAYVSAMATPKQLRQQSLFMVLSSVLFAITGYVVLSVYDMGATGLVTVNAVVMAARIAYSWMFVAHDIEARGGTLSVTEGLPAGLTLATAVGARAHLLRFDPSMATNPRDIVKFGASAGVYALGICYFEREFLLGCYRMMRSGRTQKQE